MSWPALAPGQRKNPTAHVVDDDLRALGVDLVKRHSTELLQWKRRDQKQGRATLSRTAYAILPILGAFRGLLGGRDGCGVQASADSWGRLLGVTPRMVGYAFAELAEAGLAWRRPRQVRFDWTFKWVDPAGIARQRSMQHADVHSVAYLSAAGVVRLERRHEKNRPGEIRRLVVAGDGQERRVLVAGGFVGKLLTLLRKKMQLVAKRLSALRNRFRPTALRPEKKNQKTGLRGSPVGNASGRSVSRRTPTPSNPGADPPVAGMGCDLTKLQQLFDERNLHPWTAWPDLWRPLRVNQRTGRTYPRTKQHWWLIRECTRLAQHFTKLELLQRARLVDGAQPPPSGEP